MNIMQGQDNWIWLLAEVATTIFSVIAVWYVTIIGRDRDPAKQKRGEEAIVSYGDIEEDHAPLPKFLIWTYVLFGGWTAAYLVWTGFHGLN
ncbi:hypothetical protein CCAX7_61260 [Capsulimonas corticalis]|uniref:Uncharacterized protein n=1 Tax=Capsulimonas corticalis TaxID=2219043 RepID=A0A402CWA8_9BACT|nr:hypothetical protein [Capsulimonas corticalis]BDI34075.1 hypothetical protein CCAX7_61260 [Capsulimonas corticalis]